jgi:hypothetical protein
MQKLNLSQWLKTRWTKGTRYYEAHLQQDLWGNWIINKTWGGIGTKRGGSKHLLCANYGEGTELLQSISKIRGNRGYIDV